MRLFWFVTGILLVSPFVAQAQTDERERPDGRITGTVVDQSQAPIAGAFVMAVETLNQSLNNPPTAKSDSTGHFEITGLGFRNYHVYASKPQDGYSEADPAYSDENQADIALSPNQSSGSVIIVLRKAGMLITDVRDRASGKTVSASYKLSVPKKWERQGQLSYPLLIHPSTDVMLEVSASGYKTWFYSDASNPSRPLPLRLESGEQRTLRIELERVENGALPNR
jgi:Carboxypeptidase regulatory-like domain